jgi:hypothetical protein
VTRLFRKNSSACSTVLVVWGMTIVSSQFVWGVTRFV